MTTKNDRSTDVKQYTRQQNGTELKGRRGAPRTKPRRQASPRFDAARDIIGEVFAEKTTISVNGEKKQVTVDEANAIRTATEAAHGMEPGFSTWLDYELKLRKARLDAGLHREEERPSEAMRGRLRDMPTEKLDKISAVCEKLGVMPKDDEDPQ